MKYGPLLVILLIFYLDGVSQDYEKHRFAAVDEPPVGNIKTMMEQKFSFTDKASVDSPVADRFLKVTAMKKHEFDKEKLSIVTQIYSVYDTNVVFSKHDLRFDAQGNNMRSDYSYASGSKGYIYTKLKRDAQGRVIEKRSYQSAPSFKENLIWLDMYKYDSRGNMLEDISYRGAEKIFSIRHTYTYDNNNNMLSQAVFVDTNSRDYREAPPCEKDAEKYVVKEKKGFIYKVIREYQDNRLVHSFSVSRFGCYNSDRRRIVYNSDGDQEQVILTAESGLHLSLWKGTYVNRKLVLETKTRGSGNYTLTDSIRRHYDAAGDMVEVLKYTHTGFHYETVKYTYDDHHNWLTKLTISNNKPKELVRRRITYHD